MDNTAGLSHPFSGLGPLELGKIAAFCLELGNKNKTYFVIHILVSFLKICVSVHVSLYIQCFKKSMFDFTYYSTQICHFFSTVFNFFLKESNWENLGSKLGKKRYYFALGMGPNIGLKLGRSRAPTLYKN